MENQSNGSSSEKKREVNALLDSLEQDLNRKIETKQQSLSSLSRLKVLGRDPQDADAISEKRGLEILAVYGLDGDLDESALESLRCLANALLLVPGARQTFVDLGLAPKVSRRLSSAEVSDHEFLFSRILFLLTYETNLDFEELIANCDLKDAILQNINRHAKASEEGPDRKTASSASMDTMAISETLKLLFNITHFYPSLSEEFSPAIPALLTILRKEEISPQDPLQPPIGHTINAFLNLDIAGNPANLFPNVEPGSHVQRLVSILDSAVSTYSSPTIDSQASPLVSLISRVYENAPEGMQDLIRQHLLPSDKERTQPLGRSNSLAAKLLRLSTSARTPELRDTILTLMFDISDKDPSTFVKNVGYGYASGFLVNHNISTSGLVPQDGSSSEASSNSKKAGGNPRDINFVTGQYTAEEPADEGPEMSEEEKIREAERLFVLFERLKNTGVVEVQNPVEAAARSGQLEELD